MDLKIILVVFGIHLYFSRSFAFSWVILIFLYEIFFTAIIFFERQLHILTVIKSLQSCKNIIHPKKLINVNAPIVSTQLWNVPITYRVVSSIPRAERDSWRRRAAPDAGRQRQPEPYAHGTTQTYKGGNKMGKKHKWGIRHKTYLNKTFVFSFW